MKFMVCAIFALVALTHAEDETPKEKRGIIGSLGYGGLGHGAIGLGYGGVGLGHGDLGLGHGVALASAPVISHAVAAPISLGHGLGGYGGYGGYGSYGGYGNYGGYGLSGLHGGWRSSYVSAPIVTKTISAAPISVGYSGLGYGGKW